MRFTGSLELQLASSTPSFIEDAERRPTDLATYLRIEERELEADVVVLADGREAVVTARVEAEPGPGPLVAMLEVAIARLGSKPMTHFHSSLPDGSSDDPGSRATCGSRSASWRWAG